MSDRSRISWTMTTWNPVTGCDRVSEGCNHCYALALARRLKAMGNPRYWRDGDPARSGPGFGLTVHWDKIEEPLGWRKPRLVFVNSMSDLFHPLVPLEAIRRILLVMEKAGDHTFQVLTKRPGRMASVLARVRPEPLPNLWLGTSVENQRWAEVRIPALLRTPAAVRFLSCEPLLGPVDLRPWLGGIDWVIVGGESGPRFRRMDPDWARTIRDQCLAAGVPFFYKQGSGLRPEMDRTLDGKRWEEMPGSRRPRRPITSPGASAAAVPAARRAG